MENRRGADDDDAPSASGGEELLEDAPVAVEWWSGRVEERPASDGGDPERPPLPPRDAVASDPAPKRPRGRPKKDRSGEASSQSLPRSPVVKRRRGRPKKSESESNRRGADADDGPSASRGEELSEGVVAVRRSGRATKPTAKKAATIGGAGAGAACDPDDSVETTPTEATGAVSAVRPLPPAEHRPLLPGLVDASACDLDRLLSLKAEHYTKLRPYDLCRLSDESLRRLFPSDPATRRGHLLPPLSKRHTYSDISVFSRMGRRQQEEVWAREPPVQPPRFVAATARGSGGAPAVAPAEASVGGDEPESASDAPATPDEASVDQDEVDQNEAESGSDSDAAESAVEGRQQSDGNDGRSVSARRRGSSLRGQGTAAAAFGIRAGRQDASELQLRRLRDVKKKDPSRFKMGLDFSRCADDIIKKLFGTAKSDFVVPPPSHRHTAADVSGFQRLGRLQREAAFAAAAAAAAPAEASVGGSEPESAPDTPKVAPDEASVDQDESESSASSRADSSTRGIGAAESSADGWQKSGADGHDESDSAPGTDTAESAAKKQQRAGGDSSADESKPAAPDTLVTPRDHDVLCGHADNVLSHPGNKRFSALIARRGRDFHGAATMVLQEASQKDRRETAPPAKASDLIASREKLKNLVASQVVEDINRLDPPGRFLARDPERGFWFELEEEMAVQTARRALEALGRHFVDTARKRKRPVSDENEGGSTAATAGGDGDEDGATAQELNGDDNDAAPTKEKKRRYRRRTTKNWEDAARLAVTPPATKDSSAKLPDIMPGLRDASTVSLDYLLRLKESDPKYLQTSYDFSRLSESNLMKLFPPDSSRESDAGRLFPPAIMRHTHRELCIFWRFGRKQQKESRRLHGVEDPGEIRAREEAQAAIREKAAGGDIDAIRAQAEMEVVAKVPPPPPLVGDPKEGVDAETPREDPANKQSAMSSEYKRPAVGGLLLPAPAVPPPLPPVLPGRLDASLYPLETLIVERDRSVGLFEWKYDLIRLSESSLRALFPDLSSGGQHPVPVQLRHKYSDVRFFLEKDEAQQRVEINKLSTLSTAGGASRAPVRKQPPPATGAVTPIVASPVGVQPPLPAYVSGMMAAAASAGFQAASATAAFQAASASATFQAAYHQQLQATLAARAAAAGGQAAPLAASQQRRQLKAPAHVVLNAAGVPVWQQKDSAATAATKVAGERVGPADANAAGAKAAAAANAAARAAPPLAAGAPAGDAPVAPRRAWSFSSDSSDSSGPILCAGLTYELIEKCCNKDAEVLDGFCHLVAEGLREKGNFLSNRQPWLFDEQVDGIIFNARSHDLMWTVEEWKHAEHSESIRFFHVRSAECAAAEEPEPATSRLGLCEYCNSKRKRFIKRCRGAVRIRKKEYENSTKDSLLEASPTLMRKKILYLKGQHMTSMRREKTYHRK